MTTEPVRAAFGVTTDGPILDMRGGPRMITALPDGLPWASVQLVLETGRVFVVQLTGHRGKRFIVLAKRGLTDPVDLKALRRALTGDRPAAA